jgi:hypothetical protein
VNYPVILCGDQLEFEMEHADTPPKERPDWPLPSFDARDWAEAFCKLNPGMDEGLMISWFANALMRGYDEAMSRESRVRDLLKSASYHVESEGDVSLLTMIREVLE